jgi:UDP-glucose:O-linked fucose beta-1,3-glucosyltransferase
MYYKQEEQRLSKAEKELNDLKAQIFKHSQELFKLRQEGQNYLSEINGATAADKNLQAKIHRLDAESLKQQELVYNQEYQLQQLERKISRAQGERTNEEKQILTTKIKGLTVELENQTEQHSLLAQQQKKIVEDVR